MPEPLLDERQAAKALNLSPSTLRNWRHIGRGPRYVKLGGAVRYRPSDIDAWLDSSTGGT